MLRVRYRAWKKWYDKLPDERKAVLRAEHWDRFLRTKYGISTEEYLELARVQEYVCAICGKPETGRQGMLYVDHDHRTGQVRGLLCHKCNSGLAAFGDDPDVLLRAYSFLLGG